MGTAARPWDTCLDAAMIPTLSSRGRPGSPEAAYWRRHPPTSWKASQALLLEESIAQPTGLAEAEEVADTLSSLVVTEPFAERSEVPAAFQAATDQVAPDQGAPAQTPQAAIQQPQADAASCEGGWLPLLVWALVLLIDGAMALKELAGPWVAIWREKAPWSRREGRAQGAIRGGWPAPMAGQH
ncbi:hypothetical protein [Synechococcus sp. EJ6-Ellesmere]|uniref:hypothetical protein n=1 Tax=Synechococcus sp. EJ6-Ellesmere TaxID=2823734 RepID=UPI0020CDFC89|nr:hypothetical protein [Synechococcus sp. EJ6-Ellesmere]